MNKKIEKLEDAAVGDKGWAMSGEVGKAARPVNSLLEEDLIFDFATKVKPVITEEYTQSLEDIIKRRIVEVCLQTNASGQYLLKLKSSSKLVSLTISFTGHF